MGSIGKQIPEYIQQRREDYVKTKEKEREALKVSESRENKYLSVFVDMLDSSEQEKGSNGYGCSGPTGTAAICSWK